LDTPKWADGTPNTSPIGVTMHSDGGSPSSSGGTPTTGPIGGTLQSDGGYPLAGKSTGGFRLQGDGIIAVGGRDGGSNTYSLPPFDGTFPVGGQGGTVPVGGRGGTSRNTSFTIQGDGTFPVGGRGGTSSTYSYPIHSDGSMPVGGVGGGGGRIQGDGALPVGGRGGGNSGTGRWPVGGAGGSGVVGGSTSRGGQAGGGASGGSSVTSLSGSKALNALTKAEVSQLCIDSYGTLETVISHATTCKWKGLVYAISSSAPSDAILKQNCTSQEAACLQSSAGSSACEGIPATCAATVSQYFACISDQAVAFNQTVSGLPSCAMYTKADTAAVWDAMTGDPPASCLSLSNQCPALSPPSPF
jgi:hypothetical protein